jgi:hypothetical protein
MARAVLSTTYTQIQPLLFATSSLSFCLSLSLYPIFIYLRPEIQFNLTIKTGRKRKRSRGYCESMVFVAKSLITLGLIIIKLALLVFSFEVYF